MDLLTVASTFAAFAGLGLAWHMHRRACRAEAETARIRGELHTRHTPAPVPNQRPWRLVNQRPRQRAYPPP